MEEKLWLIHYRDADNYDELYGCIVMRGTEADVQEMILALTEAIMYDDFCAEVQYYTLKSALTGKTLNYDDYGHCYHYIEVPYSLGV